MALACRPAKEADVPACLDVYAAARRFMAASGNPGQWGPSWPPAALVAEDVSAGRLWVAEEGGRVCGCFAVCPGEEPSYASIDGAWLDGSPYVTLHRVASDGTARGVLAAAVAQARSENPHVRIDTHRDNAPMLRAVASQGFSPCGTVTVHDGTERLAFELV